MRLVVTGADAHGRSRVVHDGDPGDVQRLLPAADALRSEHESLPAWPAGPPGPGQILLGRLARSAELGPVAAGGDAVDHLALPPGESRWVVVDHGPRVTAAIHRTATLDYDLVLSGQIDLVLDEGPVRLSAGDAVVLPGVRHGWRTGELGCRLAIVMIGLP